MSALREVSIPLRVETKYLANVLCSGFEGGIQYWGRVVGATTHSCDVETCMRIYHQPLLEGGPFLVGGHIDVKVQDTGRKYFLTLDKIKRGIQVIADKYPHHLGAVLGDSGKQDATTGDVLIQCALFGELRYG